MTPPDRAARNERRAIVVVAAFEAFKGVVVLLAASGLTLLVHENLHALAVQFVAHEHLNPASHYPRIFIDAANRLQDTRLTWLALGAAAYSAMRLVEAYGLFRRAAWAEILAAASGAIYLPLELADLWHRFNWPGVGALAVNLVVVAFMLAVLRRRRREPA